jgi:hypothetical protein
MVEVVPVEARDCSSSIITTKVKRPQECGDKAWIITLEVADVKRSI